jgi:nitrogen-specific signal transduction histidine kinase/CheY-like chemotaxis protein
MFYIAEDTGIQTRIPLKISEGAPGMNQPMLSLLLVEDDAAQSRLMCETLKHIGGAAKFSVTCVDRLDGAMDILSKTFFDALLLDLSLPDSSGMQTIERVQSRFGSLPIIVMTGNDDQALAFEALKKGAQDYLIKGQTDEKSLFRSIHYAVERKRSADDLSKVTQLLGTILDTTHMLIAYMDPSFNFVRVNLAFAHADGKDVKSYKGSNYFTLHPGKEQEKIFQETARSGLPHYEYGKALNFGAGAGEPSYWDWSLAPTKDEAGTVTGLVYTLVDVTKQKLVEDEINKSRELLEIKVTARTSELQDANDLLKQEIKEKIRAQEALSKRQEVLESIYAIETTFSNTLECSYDQIVLTISNIIAVPYAAAAHVDKNRFKAISQVFNGRFDHSRPAHVGAHPCGIVYDKKKIVQYAGDLSSRFTGEMQGMGAGFTSYIGVPILDKEGKVLGMICALDTAPRHFSEYEVHLIEIFSRYMGHEIERELMEEQLRASNEMNLLGRLASGVAHEVRNPLNGILAISEALFKSIGDNEEYLPYLEHIRNQVHRLSALMKGLLDLGKPLSPDQFSALPLQEVVGAVIDSFRHSSRHKQREIEVAFAQPGAVLHVNADSVKIQQVFFNLLDNACDHSPETSKISIEIAGPDDGYAVIRVIDRGTGVAPELLTRVFEPFFTTRKGGTGLGLSIVKHIVEMHGGVIAISNNLDAGLTVEVRLPVLPVSS